MEENIAVLETPEVIKHTGAEWYRDVSLEDAEVFIRSNLQSAVRSVIATGFYLKHIRDNEMYLEAGYKNINEYAMDRFGLSASATSRYITRNTRFSRGGNSPLIDDRFKDFSKSQLQEMLGMSDEQLEQVTPDMTVREIRNMARPKEIPYIEIPGQTELKDIPGVMPEERAESFEASTAELFDVEEDENMVQPVAGKPISQEISITELVEEEDAEIATSQLLPEETAANEQRNEPVEAAEKHQMGHCLHRPEYACSLPEEYMHRPGSGTDCAHECCWECVKHGECKLECNSSADRPETEEEIAMSQTDNEASEDEVKERIDIELLRELLERKKQLLSKCLGTPGIDKSDEHIRMQKLEVGALASMLCELEDLEEKKDRPKQPELPPLRNNDQRAAFIDTYETWPLWIDNQETGERYYRYDLQDGTSFVIKTYHSMLYDWKADVAMRYKEGYGANEEYLLEPGKFFRDCRTNRTTLIEKLKEIQRGERQWMQYVVGI
ncbi:MAG: hypothetical protein UEM33_03990 [Enterocloster sp.]|nr:hypothetical protein [Enterocloster sp.]